MNKKTYEQNHRRSRDLRKVLADTLYMPDPPNEYKRMLSDILQKLHSLNGAYRKNKSNVPFKNLSSKQYAVIDNAIIKYKRWCDKDKNDPEFIAKKSREISKLKTLLSLIDSYYEHPMQLSSNRKIVLSMIEQIEKRKVLLTNKQKLLCNKKFKEINKWKPWYDKEKLRKEKNTG
tara:strand:- start:54 stop:578 length:525 start_codon:yes stop_codon:yes gene_type:complete